MAIAGMHVVDGKRWNGSDKALIRSGAYRVPCKSGIKSITCWETRGHEIRGIDGDPISPDGSTPSDEGFIYHATNQERAYDIAKEGLNTHEPWDFTDQEEWPDGTTERRSYFAPRASSVWAFAPEEGKPVILRTRMTKEIKREGTGDLYTTKKLPANRFEILTTDGWEPLTQWSTEETGLEGKKTRRKNGKRRGLFGQQEDIAEVAKDAALEDDYERAERILSEGKPRKIRIAFTKMTPESAEDGDVSERGWVDEEGDEIEIDADDIEDAREIEDVDPITQAVVTKTVKWLRNRGAYHPSSSEYDPNLWYSSNYEITDYSTGEEEQEDYFLDNFTPEEKKAIFEAFTGRLRSDGTYWLDPNRKKAPKLKGPDLAGPDKSTIACGDCFRYASQLATSKGGILKQGLVTHPWDKNTFPHAWVEKGGKVYDWQTIKLRKAKPMKIADWYKLWNPHDVNSFTADEARVAMLKTKHYGPWPNLNRKKAKKLEGPDLTGPKKPGHYETSTDEYAAYTMFKRLMQDPDPRTMNIIEDMLLEKGVKLSRITRSADPNAGMIVLDADAEHPTRISWSIEAGSKKPSGKGYNYKPFIEVVYRGRKLKSVSWSKALDGRGKYKAESSTREGAKKHAVAAAWAIAKDLKQALADNGPADDILITGANAVEPGSKTYPGLQTDYMKNKELFGFRVAYREAAIDPKTREVVNYRHLIRDDKSGVWITSSLAQAEKIRRKYKNRTAWIEDENGNFVPVKGAKRPVTFDRDG